MKQKRLARLTTPPELVILDFDGVVADSELLSNSLLAEFLTLEGLPTTVDQAIDRYMGRRWTDCEALIARDLPGPMAPDFTERYRRFQNGRMRAEVTAIEGVAGFLRAHRGTRFCVASSSSIGWLDHGVDKFGLRAELGTSLFSATEVANGKPAPDIFLHAAQRMQTDPARCVVIEDSTAGIRGARAAAMTAVGFLGGAHVRAEHGDALLAAGAHALADRFDSLGPLLGLPRGHE